MSETEDKIVGHKTFFDKERGFYHEPLRQSEANDLLAACDARAKEIAARLPDERTAIVHMTEAHHRLEQDFGWRSAIYCPKDGTHFQCIEPGSSGIHDGWYDGEWPDGHWWVNSDMGPCPSHPSLFKLYPEDQAKEDARRAEAIARYHSQNQDTK